MRCLRRLLYVWFCNLVSLTSEQGGTGIITTRSCDSASYTLLNGLVIIPRPRWVRKQKTFPGIQPQVEFESAVHPFACLAVEALPLVAGKSQRLSLASGVTICHMPTHYGVGLGNQGGTWHDAHRLDIDVVLEITISM